MKSKISVYRKKIDKIDQAIIFGLKKRMDIVYKIGEEKRKLGIKTTDRKREKEMFENFERISLKQGIDYEFIKKIFSLVLKQSKNIQRNNKI